MSRIGIIFTALGKTAESAFHSCRIIHTIFAVCFLCSVFTSCKDIENGSDFADVTETCTLETAETAVQTAEDITVQTSAAQTLTSENTETTTARRVESNLSGDVTDYAVNIGIPLEKRYPDEGNIARFIPDIIAFDGRIYVGGGDDEGNQGSVPLMAYDEKSGEWVCEYEKVPEEKIQSFDIINDTLMFSGADPTEDWSFGNYYFLKDGKWIKRRNIPEAVHDYDLYWYDDCLFIGIGSAGSSTENIYPALRSADGGETFVHIDFLKNDTPIDITNMPIVRVYNFFEFAGEFYCTLWVRSENRETDYFELYRYEKEEGKFVFAEDLDYFTQKKKYNPRRFTSTYEINGKLLMVNENGLHSTCDFKSFEMLDVGGADIVSDLNVYDDIIYVLTNTYTNEGYVNALFKSTDGETFAEMFRFKTPIPSYCFTIGENGYYFTLGNRFCTGNKLLGTVWFIPFDKPDNR